MKKEDIYEFIQKIMGDSKNTRDEWYHLISNNPEIISIDFVDMILKLDKDYINHIIKALQAGLDTERIKKYVKAKISIEDLKSILHYHKRGVKLEIIDLYIREEFRGKIGILNYAACYLDNETIKKYIDLDLQPWKKVQILNFMSNNRDIQQEYINILANKNLNDLQFNELTATIKKSWKDLTIEQLKFIANPEFNHNQMYEITLGYMHKLKQRQISFYAKAKNPCWRMMYIRLGFENKLSIKKINYYLSNKFDSSYKMECVYKCFLYGLSLEEVKDIVEISKGNTKKINIYRYFLVNGFTIQDLREIANIDIDIIEGFYKIEEELKRRLSVEQIKFLLMEELNFSQMTEVIKGFEYGLTQQQIETYAKRGIDSEVMKEFRICFECGSSIKEIKKLIKNNMSICDISTFRQKKEKEKENAQNEHLYKLICENLNLN